MLFDKLAAKDELSQFSLVHPTLDNGHNDHNKHDEYTDTATTTPPPTPDRLFVLPYDLLELIATTYFSQKLAVKVLCVNSQFHEAFSRVVWRSLHLNDALLTKISNSAWRSYGHLVRIMDCKFYKEESEMDADLIPNIVKLSLNRPQLLHGSFGQVKFPKLRRLHLTLILSQVGCSEAIQYVDLVQKWIQQSNHLLHVYWAIVASPYRGHIRMETIDKMLSTIGIDNIAHHSFSFTFRSHDPATLVQLPIIADSLTKLNAIESGFGYKCFFNHNNNITYSRLKSLTLNNSQHPPPEIQHWMPNIAPNWLPSLVEVILNYSYGATNQSWFVDMFQHTWSTLTKIHLNNCNSVMDFNAIISHTPNLWHLCLWKCTFSLEVSALATYVPRLGYLSLGSRLAIDMESHQHQHKLTALKTLRISLDREFESVASIPKNALQFIIRAAPSLQSIRFYEVRGIPESDLDDVHDMVNPAVRSLRIHASNCDYDFAAMPKLMELFPNLSFMEISGRSDLHEIKNKLRQEYPKLAIF